MCDARDSDTQQTERDDLRQAATFVRRFAFRRVGTRRWKLSCYWAARRHSHRQRRAVRVTDGALLCQQARGLVPPPRHSVRADRARIRYNQERPHQAVDMKGPPTSTCDPAGCPWARGPQLSVCRRYTIWVTSTTRWDGSSDRESLRLESVTYVLGIIRHPCDRNIPKKCGRDGRIRTGDPLTPSQVRYPGCATSRCRRDDERYQRPTTND
jgi:hypothetical protein